MPAVDDFQKNLNRRPIVEIIASSQQSDIPFDGTLLTVNQEDEEHPGTIIHSSGRLLSIFKKEPSVPVTGYEEIHYKYTDTDRQEFTTVIFDIGTLNSLVGVTMVELVNGNIGIMWMEYGGGSYYIKYKIITVTGTDVVSITTLDNWVDTLGDASGAHVIMLG